MGYLSSASDVAHTGKSVGTTFDSASFFTKFHDEVLVSLEFLLTAGTTGSFTPSVEFNTKPDGSGTWTGTANILKGDGTFGSLALGAAGPVTASGPVIIRVPVIGPLARVHYLGAAGNRSFDIDEHVELLRRDRPG